MILELCKGVHCVDLGESFQTHIYLQNLASIQPRTSPVKFAASRDATSTSPGAAQLAPASRLPRTSLAETIAARGSAAGRPAVRKATARKKGLLLDALLSQGPPSVCCRRQLRSGRSSYSAEFLRNVDQIFSGFFQGAPRKNTERSARGRQRGADSEGQTAEGRPSMAN